MLTPHLFPFYSLSNYQLHNEFQSIKEKLEEVINNSVLSDFLTFLKPYYHQIGFNPIQAGLFWNHIGCGPHSVSPLFVVQLPLNLAC